MLRADSGGYPHSLEWRNTKHLEQRFAVEAPRSVVPKILDMEVVEALGKEIHHRRRAQEATADDAESRLERSSLRENVGRRGFYRPSHLQSNMGLNWQSKMKIMYRSWIPRLPESAELVVQNTVGAIVGNKISGEGGSRGHAARKTEEQ
ncbi:hypothetical protein L6452_19974 [Arctium lappa]|uniref:Uncharacterized protein n=1 Tax=Arctium lappa TaxID=4217 RepID=A0ACB9B996_ARCLA|nr:hypothetical protein L6452_19974 [Arctium lappa]